MAANIQDHSTVEGHDASKKLVSIADIYSSIPSPFATTTEVVFETENSSPFPDGYSILKEREALRDLLESDTPNENDPRFKRLMLYEERLLEFNAMQEEYENRAGAEKIVSTQEAAHLQSLGSLINEDQDTMQLHTKEAFRLFMGRAKDPNGQFAQIVGGKRVAAALKCLWLLSGADNPYADWALLRHEELMQDITRRLEREVNRLQQKLEAQRSRGLQYSILRSAEPKVLLLGFKSPYGYAISDLVVHFDYYIRTVKTLVRKDQLTDDQGRQSIRELTRAIRAAFIETARFERFLMRPELRDLCRADFVPNASGDAAKRQTDVIQLLGQIPPDVYSGKIQPRHSRRRLNLAPNEKAILAHVSSEMAKQAGNDIDATAIDKLL
ncbi:PFL_4669 family integrating conjugative element protein [Janthinobacterium psychrotolerans]|uniref:Integrating conjugative element protein, PFL_4669 family n=1 Tax=Janthinobacterium psychrotolerans TaxID=1747903 RepID=A0A1A7C627_9BURK|nr:TIGR03761 family integrating conjugative element protein [Janthinobacterium psychrotolerans]OBV41162.1 integrating conjugative element protein, PFL_4669 family [Janthinobacterium psychrotolerans]